jgi:hypothetical protein
MTGFTGEKVYIGMTYSANKILLEDNSYLNNEYLWGKDEYGSTYDSYLEYINKFLEKNISERDSNGFILFSEYHSEFSKITDIRPGDKFYVSTKDGIFEATVSGYLINPEYSYFSSNIFYVLLDAENLHSFGEWTPVVISINPDMSIMRMNITSPAEVYNNGMEIIKKNTIGKKFTVHDYENDTEIQEEFSNFYEEDYRFFEGKFTQNFKYEYIANLSSRLSFMYYINAVFIINDKGYVIHKIAEPQEKDFSYFIVKGIIDIDNDGIDEILIDVGYYEGTGLYLYKYDGSEYNIIAEGFIAGV